MINLDVTFIFQIVNFLILLLVLNVFLFKPIRKVLADRQQTLAGARKKAADVDADVQEKVALYEARLREVKHQAQEDRGAMIKEAKAEETIALDKARREATEVLGSIKEKVGKEAAEAKKLLEVQARSLSLEICEKVLGRSL